MTDRRWPLRDVIARLERHYGRPARPKVTDPFEMAIYEAVAYLVPDDRRREVFDQLKKEIGLSPMRLAAAPRAKIAAVIARGGMQPDRRAEKVQDAADLALEIGQRDLAQLCRKDPDKARKTLARFPGIGEPGADKILLYNRCRPGLAPDSNGLRVLNRLGFGAEMKDYRKMYRAAEAAVADELPASFDWMIAAHQLLRRHGQERCTRNVPQCAGCPLVERCPGRC